MTPSHAESSPSAGNAEADAGTGHHLRWLLWGVGGAIGLAVVGFGLRSLGLDYPLGGLFMELTHLLGVPDVFNYVHRLLGYSDLAKNLAFAGSFGLWIVVHCALVWAYPRIGAFAVAVAFLFYIAFADALAAAAYALLFWSLALWAWWDSPGRFDVQRRDAVRKLAGGVLAVAGVVGILRFIADWMMRKAMDGDREAARIDPSPGRTTVWERVDGLSAEVTPQSELYYVSKNPEQLDPDIMADGYSLMVGGRVDSPYVLSFEALTALPAVERVMTLMCISNPVGGDLIGTPVWTGVPMTTLLRRAGMPPRADLWLNFRAADDYTESIALAELPDDAMVAYAMNGEPLWRRHGHPTRLLLPGRYGMKQPKWLTEIEVADRGVTGYWAERGWSRSAFIRMLSRIDTPAPGARVPVGQEVAIAGIAFAGTADIGRVDVSTDGGESWREAGLKEPLAEHAWRLWMTPWTPDRPGERTLVVRAVQADGTVQPVERTPSLPDGATGLHRVPLTAVA